MNTRKFGKTNNFYIIYNPCIYIIWICPICFKTKLKGTLCNKSNKRFGLIGKGEEIALYTLDIEQGSSGSAVFSKKTKKLCGNINATMKKTNLTLGITNNGIKKFIKVK